jgi:cyclase
MTLTKRIIPCLDVKNGRVVKGLNFESIKDAGDPVELAEKYSNEGADELVFLDITASDEQRKTIKDLVRKVASVIDIPFTVGGGVKSLEDARNILLNGADKVGINTGAIKNPKVISELMELFGRQCVVVAVDAKRNYNIDETKNIFIEDDKKFWFEVFIYGGKEGTGIDVIKWVKNAEKLGAGEILLTSIDKDGTKDGYDILLTKTVVDSVSIPVIASGGCGKPMWKT